MKNYEYQIQIHAFDTDKPKQRKSRSAYCSAIFLSAPKDQLTAEEQTELKNAIVSLYDEAKNYYAEHPSENLTVRNKIVFSLKVLSPENIQYMLTI